MDPAQYKLIQQAVHEGLASTQWVLIVVSFVIAGLTAYFGTYLKKKAESAASHEDFATVLKEVEKQTETTTRIQASMQEKLEALKDNLERERSFGTFQRDRVARYLDAVFVATNEIGSLSRLVAKRVFVNAGMMAEAERTLETQVASIKLNTGILMKLNAITPGTHQKVLASLYPLTSAWDDLIGELTALDPKFRAEFPHAREFSAEKFDVFWSNFLKTNQALLDAILELPASAEVPRA